MLSIESVNKSYRDVVALKDISITIPNGSIYGLLGPNGAGKSTLIRIINRIIQADSGQILLNGEPLSEKHIPLIGYLPEERGLYKNMTAMDHLIYLIRLRGYSKAEAKDKIKDWAKRLEIDSWLDRAIEDLSKGMAQKIQFIATVAHQPPLLILDEPFSGFDPVNANLIKNEIIKLRDEGTTVLFSSHRMESVEELCDHLSLIHRSNVILSGEKMKIKDDFSDGSIIVNSQSSIVEGKTYKLISSSDSEGIYTSVIRAADASASRNDIIKELADKTEIISFVPKIPHLDEIFIKITEN